MFIPLLHDPQSRIFLFSDLKFQRGQDLAEFVLALGTQYSAHSQMLNKSFLMNGCAFAQAKELLHLSTEMNRKCKKQHLLQRPNSHFTDVKCPGCCKITTDFSHVQIVVLCVGCCTVLCQSKGDKAMFTEENSYLIKHT